MALQRVPLQARLDEATFRAFTEEAVRRDLTRAGLCRWLVTTYLAENALGRKLRVASSRASEQALRTPPKKKPTKKATQTACIHGNRGLCLQCAKDRAAAEM